MKDLVEYVARFLVRNPDAVNVTETVRDGVATLELRVAEEDLGRVIGKEGRTAKALRAILTAAAARKNQRVVLDIVEKDRAFEVKVDLPGLDEKDVEVKLTDGVLTIKGEKQEENEEKKVFYLHERHFGAFERSFRVPETVDGDKIEAQFKKGVLTVTLPKKPDARKPEKKIEVRAG